MNPQDLKQGQSYLILAKFDEKDFYNEYDFVAAPSDYRLVLDEASVRQCVFLPSEPPTLVGSQPKHDPCRLFRKGDKVRVVEWNGRNYCDRDHHTELKTGCLAEIWDDERDEQEEGYVSVIYEEYIRCVPPCYLELVTPVEELKPYSVTYDNKFYHINKHGEEASIAVYSEARHPNAKAAAEAERDRLNAEHRKEQQ